LGGIWPLEFEGLAMADVNEEIAREWMAAFERDPPMSANFPLLMPNGAKIDSFVGICSSCKNPIAAEMVRGQVVWSLRNVATVAANGYCQGCQRITHHACRFRMVQATYQAEWIGSDGRWYRKTPGPSSKWAHLVNWLYRLLARGR